MMSGPVDEPNQFIWATRGRTWGFRFLRTAGRANPLEVYERRFAGLEGQSTVWNRDADEVALRFPDPENRRDAAGRTIPHDFVLLGAWATAISSLEEGIDTVWPTVADEYEQCWNQPEPPPAHS